MQTNVDGVVKRLKKWNGLDIYKKSEIPSHLHFRDNKHILDVLLVSKGKEMVMTFKDGKCDDHN